MAVDTAAKRYSMLNLAGRGTLLITPDGTIDASNRQALLDCYSGIAFGAGVPPVIRDISLRGIRNYAHSLRGNRNYAHTLRGNLD